MTQALEAFQEALVGGADDDALDLAAADVRRDSGPAALVEAIKMRIAHELSHGKTDLDVTALRFRLSAALEDVAKAASDPAHAKDGAVAALEAAQLCKDVLNDGDGTARNLVHALKLAANDDATLKRAVTQAGGREPAETIVEKTLKRPEVKEDPVTTALLRRALSRIAETAGDKERAFFEALKASRKQPSDALYVDEVFRLALDTGRHTEAAAFFGALADDESLSARHRATLYNKLGQTLEKGGEKQKALDAYTKSLRLHEAKAAKRAAERLAQELGVEAPQSKITASEPVDVTPPYDHKTGTITQQEPAALSLPSKPAEVTIPRYPMTMRTAELHESVPPPDADEAAAVHMGADTEPVQVAPRPVSVPPTPPPDDDDAAPPLVSQEQGFSLANLPSFDDGPALTATDTEAPLASPLAPPLGVPSFDGVEPSNVDWKPKVSSPFSMPITSPPAMEEALARLPDRSEVPDEPTKRAPQSTITAVNSIEGTAEQVPTRRKSKEKKKKEKTQKKKRPVAPSASRVLVDNSQLDGAPMPAPEVPPDMAPATLDEGVGAHEVIDYRPPMAPAVSARKQDVGGAVADIERAALERVALDAQRNASRAPPPPPESSTSVVRDAKPLVIDVDRNIADERATAREVDSTDRSIEQDTEHEPLGLPAAGDDVDHTPPNPKALTLSPTSQGQSHSSHSQAPQSDAPQSQPQPAPRSPSPHSIGPPPGESTDLASSPQASPTLEAMPPLAMPALTVPSMEATSALANALAALDSNDADECARAARELAIEAPFDPRVIRLAGRAMSLSAATGQMPKDAVDLFVAHAVKHGDRAAAMAIEVQEKLPVAVRRAYTHVWIAGAKAAGLDVARVMDLLRETAVADAPDGPAFELAERVLIEVNDGAARDALYQAALRAVSEGAKDGAKGDAAKGDAAKVDGAKADGAKGDGAKSDAARIELTKRRLGLLENQSKHVEALQLHASLAVDLASADVGVRSAARRAFAQHGTPDERARFLSRLARKLPGDEGLDVVQELLDVRLSVDDRIGAEAAAKDLLARRPGDGRGTRVLADLLEQEPHRADELVDVLRVGAQQALSWFGKTGEARTLLERLAEVQAKAGRPEEAADAFVQVARLVPDDKNLERALAALDDVKRHKEAVALLEETASAVADASFRCRAYLRAAEIARTKLQKRGKARELVERALDLQPRDRAALRAYADLLVEIGDAAAAISALERVAAEEPLSSTNGAKERAAIQLRIGRLIEEHLLKPDDALKRYRAAAEMDGASKEAWSSIRAIARQRGDRALLVESLRGLAGAEPDAKEKAALWRQIAKVERDERADPAAAERAFVEALGLDAGDVESLLSLAALLAARLQADTDLDTALAQPNETLLEALRQPVLKAPSPSSLPLSLRRISAMALSRSGDRQAASARFDEIIEETPEDLATLMALARHLAAAPRGEQGADGRRLRCLETILLHHAYSLKPPVQVDVWGDVTALRAATGDGAGARKAAKKVMALASTDELRACLSDRAVRAVALALDDARDAERDSKAVIAALKLDAERSIVEAERSRLLERAAQIAHDELKDRVLARALLEDAVRANPASPTAREALLDLDVASGDVAGALKQVRDLLAKESDPKRKAALHLRLFRMRKKLGLDLEGAAAELKSAVELDSGSVEVLDAAEQFFTEKNDADGLDKLWSAQLRNVDRADLRARLKLLERLAQLRRYERRDLAGAVEALEAMTALDPEALKPREDAARLYTELGLAREAVGAWRGVLERDPLAVEAWRGIFGRFVATRQGDEAFAVASTMAALELADDDMARAVRTVRPPFPRWPIPPKDPQLFRRKIGHPLERAPIRAVLDVAAPRLLPLYARKLKDFGFHKRDAIPDRNVPTSVLLAVRTLAQLLGLKEPPPIFQAELGSSDGQSPPFAVLPSTDPAIIVTAEVIKGGMTPERAFALGRAAAWLQPHAVMAAAVDAATLRSILEGLTAHFLGSKSLERPDLDVEKIGKELGHALLHGLSQSDEATVKGELMPALRDYVHARQQVAIADWRAGVGYSGDRVGFLLSTDLNAAFRLIKSTAGAGQSIGARLAIKELVLFSVSSSYLALRKDLGLALPELAASPLLDLG